MDQNEFWLEFFQNLALNIQFNKDATTTDIRNHIRTCSEIADEATAEALAKGKLQPY